MEWEHVEELIIVAGVLRKRRKSRRGWNMNGIIYLVGLVVVIMFILSVLGLR
jgi:hypothetical protein